MPLVNNPSADPFGGEEEQDDDEIILCMHQMLIATTNALLVLFFVLHSNRNPSCLQQRLNWEKLSETQNGSQDFKRHLRMSQQSFALLLSYIRKDLEANETMASLRGGVILPEIRLYCTLRWLAGGSYSDIYLMVGISRSSLYRVVWKTIQAINACEELKIKLPKTHEECAKAAAGFQSISFQGCIDNCVFVVDGYHLQMTTPSKMEAKNVRSYFSGHYQTYGVNIQAACDHLSRFVFLAVAAPGVTGDRDAVVECNLFDLIESLPGLFTAIGDCAYKPTEHMAPIYHGKDKTRPKYDAFNFYASQLRIRIEMAFGLMVKKWGILSRPADIKLKNVKYFIAAIAQLHNFCINERVKEQEQGQSWAGYNNAWDVELLDITDRATRDEAAAIETVGDEFPGWSLNRERMVDKISAMRLVRPTRNKGAGAVHGQDVN